MRLQILSNAEGTVNDATVTIDPGQVANVQGYWNGASHIGGDVGFFGGTPVGQRSASDLAGLWTGLKEYGLLDAASTAPASGGGGATKAVAHLTARVIANTDSRWVTVPEGYGWTNQNWNDSRGTGADPDAQAFQLFGLTLPSWCRHQRVPVGRALHQRRGH